MIRGFFNKLFFVALFLLNFIVIFDPTNRILGIKYFVFVFVFAFFILWNSFNYKTKYGLHSIHLLFILFILSFLCHGLVVTLINQGIFISSYMINALLFVTLLMPCLINVKIYEKAFTAVLVLLVLFCFLMFIILLTNNEKLLNIFFESETIMFGYRRWGLIVFPMLYIKSCALLVFIFPLWCDKKRYWFIRTAVCGIAFVLTGTRANIIAALVMIIYVINKHISKLQRKMLILLLFLILLLSLPKIASFMQNTFFNPNEYSLNIKANHLKSYYDLFINNIDVLLFGSGIGSSFFTYAFNKYVDITELTYFESIRVFGLIMCIPFIIFLIIPLIKLKGCLRVAYGMYLFLIGTNPLLYSSTGFTAIVLVYLNIYDKKNYQSGKLLCNKNV